MTTNRPTKRPRTIRLTRAAMGALLAAAAITPSASTAQGDHPLAHLHAGACAEQGDIVATLQDPGLPPEEPGGTAPALSLAVSSSTVEVALEELVQAPHSIDVHVSADDGAPPFACADVGGHVLTDAGLVVALLPQGGTDILGMAWLDDRGEGATGIVLGVSIDGAASPGASPAAEGVALEVRTGDGPSLEFMPDAITVAPGARVRLTFHNAASFAHNLTFREPLAAATDTVVDPGASQTIEFVAPSPGTYPFVCTLHEGMDGVMTVAEDAPAS